MVADIMMNLNGLGPADRAVLQCLEDERRAAKHKMPYHMKAGSIPRSVQIRALRRLNVKGLVRHIDTKVPTIEGYTPTVAGTIKVVLDRQHAAGNE